MKLREMKLRVRELSEAEQATIDAWRNTGGVGTAARPGVHRGVVGARVVCVGHRADGQGSRRRWCGSGSSGSMPLGWMACRTSRAPAAGDVHVGAGWLRSSRSRC